MCRIPVQVFKNVTQVLTPFEMTPIVQPMNSAKYKVIRIESNSDCGQHSTRELAEKRISRLVAMSNGKLTRADFRIEGGSDAKA